MIRIGIALSNSEEQVFYANSFDNDERNKMIQKKLHRNPLLNKFEAGQQDEKYSEIFYDVLKKSDEFLRKNKPFKIAVAADKHGSSLGKDEYGKRWEHFGFFDSKHKHAGKTLGEIIVQEYEERRTKDDDYELLHIFNNEPIEAGLVNVYGGINDINELEKFSIDFFNKSKQYKFPLKIVRKSDDENDVNIVNKIEQLTEFLHVKKIGFEYRQLEFFVPLKYKTDELNEDSDIFKEIINFNNVYINDEYGDLRGYGIVKFTKRIKYNDTHEVLKFEAIEMEIIKNYKK
jgi:hypothetical protein